MSQTLPVLWSLDAYVMNQTLLVLWSLQACVTSQTLLVLWSLQAYVMSQTLLVPWSVQSMLTRTRSRKPTICSTSPGSLRTVPSVAFETVVVGTCPSDDGLFSYSF